MKIVQCRPPPNSIHAEDSNGQNIFPIETRKVGNIPTGSWAELHLNVSAVHYRSVEDKESQMSHQTVIQSDDFPRLALDWWHKDHSSYKYSAYRDKFFFISTKFQSNQDEHIGRITVANHRIDFVDGKTQPVHTTSYSAGPKSKNFEELEIEKMLF